MDIIKNFGRMLLDYYDKIVLGILLAGLACVMVQQSCSMQVTSKEVQEARKPKNPPTGKIAELDMTQFNAKLEVDPANTWQPVSRVVREETYQIPGISVALRSYLLNFGETSLFDPAVYVYSAHKDDYLVHYDTVINPSTGLPENPGEKPTNPVNPTNPITPSTPSGKLIKLVRLYRINQQYFPAVLRRITPNDATDKTTWLAQIDLYETSTRKKSIFKRIGDSFEVPHHSGTFKIVDMEYQKVPDAQNIPREVSSVTLRQGDNQDEKIVLPRNKPVVWGGAIYRLVVLPPVDSNQKPFAITVEPDKPFMVRVNFASGPRQEIYRVVEQVGETLKVVEQGDPQTTYEVNKLERTDLDKYKDTSGPEPGMDENGPMPEPTPE